MEYKITDIKYFLENGEIISDKKNPQKVNEIKRNSDESWNGISTFNYDGFSIEFIIDEKENEIKGTQIQIWNSPSDFNLKQIYLLTNAEKHLNEIYAVYFDNTDETVILLKNGINIHYNSGKLSLITSKSKPTRKLILETMTKKK
jgi:hypothetical protein